ncbi:MAG: hypothetical protein HYX67_17435, partial [Candidatus Melainabacteria bacterium]|nr:hypothetical protein [Candidatus Melainabacteria bacterium]
MKSIVPYSPQPFPPPNPKSPSALLKKTTLELECYSALLKAQPLSRILLQPLEKFEALDSTQSQKTQTPWRELFLSSGSHDKISQYLHALHWGFSTLEQAPLTTKFICTLHQKIKRGFTPKMDLGVLRNRQNWIGAEGCSIEEAYFYPPAVEKVRTLMHKLCTYAEKRAL